MNSQPTDDHAKGALGHVNTFATPHAPVRSRTREGSEAPILLDCRQAGEQASTETTPPIASDEGVGGLVILGLAGLPDRALLDETALAGVLRCTKRTIQNLVQRFELPPPLPLAGRKVWVVKSLMGWLEERSERLGAKAIKEAERLGA